MTNKNNIVLIMTDTQGTNIRGCYGRPEMKTPCIDKLADEGIKFERAYSCQPVCGPARAAIVRAFAAVAGHRGIGQSDGSSHGGLDSTEDLA